MVRMHFYDVRTTHFNMYVYMRFLAKALSILGALQKQNRSRHAEQPVWGDAGKVSCDKTMPRA
jgi:hypothetical protein